MACRPRTGVMCCRAARSSNSRWPHARVTITTTSKIGSLRFESSSAEPSIQKRHDPFVLWTGCGRTYRCSHACASPCRVSYLYDGDFRTRNAICGSTAILGQRIVLAADGELSWASRRASHSSTRSNFIAPFVEQRFRPEQVLLWRIRARKRLPRSRIGVRRRARMRAESGTFITRLCAVDRAPDYPRRPRDYVPLDDFGESAGMSGSRTHDRFQLARPRRAGGIAEAHDLLALTGERFSVTMPVRVAACQYPIERLKRWSDFARS